MLPFPSRHGLAALAALLFLLSACAPSFDAVADRQLSEAQARFDEGATALISAARTAERLRARVPPPPAATLQEARDRLAYAAHRAWYDSVDASVSSARLRITADAATPPGIDRGFGELLANLDDLRSVHEAQDALSSVSVIAMRNTINGQFRTLMQYQLTLRTGRRTT